MLAMLITKKKAGTKILCILIMVYQSALVYFFAKFINDFILRDLNINFFTYSKGCRFLMYHSATNVALYCALFFSIHNSIHTRHDAITLHRYSFS